MSRRISDIASHFVPADCTCVNDTFTFRPILWRNRADCPLLGPIPTQFRRSGPAWPSRTETSGAINDQDLRLFELRTRTPRTFPRSSCASAKSGFPPSPPHCAASTCRRLKTNALPVTLTTRRGPIAWHKPCWARQARFLNHMQRMYPAKFPANIELHPNQPGCVKKRTGQI
jgi:hypothetical protein